jgi:hypothetical protein
MCRYEDVLDILGFRGGELLHVNTVLRCGRRQGEVSTLILVPPLTLFSKELAIRPEGGCWICAMRCGGG